MHQDLTCMAFIPESGCKEYRQRNQTQKAAMCLTLTECWWNSFIEGWESMNLPGWGGSREGEDFCSVHGSLPSCPAGAQQSDLCPDQVTLPGDTRIHMLPPTNLSLPSGWWCPESPQEECGGCLYWEWGCECPRVTQSLQHLRLDELPLSKCSSWMTRRCSHAVAAVQPCKPQSNRNFRHKLLDRTWRGAARGPK